MDVSWRGAGLSRYSKTILAHRRSRKVSPRTGTFEALSSQAARGCCGAGEGLVRKDHVSEGTSEGRVDEFWQDFLGSKRRKETLAHPAVSNHAPFLTKWQKPAWVERDAQVDTVIRRPPGLSARLAADEFGTCRRLCEDGKVTEAVDALSLLVHKGCYIPSKLFYCVLKRCIAQKGLALGRRIHALSVKNGYEGNAYLATQLIGLYASHGRLEEAMRVFSKVTTPSGHNWASIILAYARHGEPDQAIALYRRMRETTVQADNHIFVAVLKACGSARDLAVGKGVHAHICASAVKPDIFVQTSLVDMYAKCGSLEDAQKVFDRLPQKNVVTWTAMIAGYAQQGMAQKALILYSSMQQEGITPPNPLTFAFLLQACASVGVQAIHQGKQLHVQIEERGLQDDIVVGNSLISMYAKCGSLEDAQRVFDSLSKKDVVTWTAMIACYGQLGLGQEALSLYTCMQQEGISPPNSVTFICLLQACANVRALHQGKKLQAQIEEQGLQADVVVANSLINMYTKCGSLGDAQKVFDRLFQKDVVTWNSMIAGYVQQGMGQVALRLYTAMQQEGITPPDSVTFVCLLQACASVGVAALKEGQQLHAQIEEQRLFADVIVGNSLVDMYAKCGSLEDGRRVFDRLSHRDVVTWNVMIAGYAQQGLAEEALCLYTSMLEEGIMEPSSATFVCLLQACAILGLDGLHMGRQLHIYIKESRVPDDVVLGASLVNMYSKCGSLQDSQRVFDKLSQKNVITWNTIIAGYAKQGMGEEAFSLYSRMQQESITPPDSVTFVCLLQVCASMRVGALRQGKQLHRHIEEQGLQLDVVVSNSLINMYAKCGSLGDAQRVFDELPYRDVVTWNALIAGYSQQGMGREALSLYASMQQEGSINPSSATFVCLLKACASVGATALKMGKQLHVQIEERRLEADIVVGNSLVDMYAKCGNLDAARRVFDRLPDRDVVTWNAMITGYAQQGMGEEALSLYTNLQRESITPPDALTFVCLLQACASVGALPLGKQLHEQIEEQGLHADLDVGPSLINMYAKCGSLQDAQQVFDSLPERSVVAWDALIAGYGRQGNIQIVLDLMDRMRLDGIEPDGITLLSVLSACSHMGIVDTGRHYFQAMTTDYGISPTIKHYTCMIDLLARAGHLDEALGMVKTMPFEPNCVVWHTLLTSCRKWGNVEVGRQAFEFAVRLDEKDAAAYVVMSNIYAGAEMWEEAEAMQANRKKVAAWKQPGQSWSTDLDGVMHSFVV